MKAPDVTEQKALDLIRKFGLEAPPIPADELAESLGAQLIYEPFDGDVSGLLMRDQGGVVIGVNARHHPNRQRFTLAHEIGHLQLHKTDSLFVDKQMRLEFRDKRAGMAIYRKEIQANRFAAELLMPRHVLNREVEKLLSHNSADSGSFVIASLSKRFGVSHQAMQYRLTNLGYWAPL